MECPPRYSPPRPTEASRLLIEEALAGKVARERVKWQKPDERVHFATGPEYIQSVQDSKTWRLKWRWLDYVQHRRPLLDRRRGPGEVRPRSSPGIKTTDVMTSFNLVYTLL